MPHRWRPGTRWKTASGPSAVDLSEPSLSSPRRPGFVAFGYRDFMLFWASRCLSVLAIEMQATTVGWQVYRITGRELDLGLVGLAQFAPFALLFLISGILADRLPRVRIMAGCLFVQMLCATGFCCSPCQAIRWSSLFSRS
jgi:MFS family permease